MNCLVFSTEIQHDWVKEFFPGVNPYYLKLLNKPLLEYYIDFCVLMGINQVRIINTETGSDLESYFGDGTQWGVKLGYGFAKPEDTISSILAKNRRFAEAGLLVIYGYQFIHYSKQVNNYDFFGNGKSHYLGNKDCGLLYLPPAENLRKLDLDAIPEMQSQNLKSQKLKSISTYYNLSMNLISKDRSNYVLPGYNNEDGVYLGKNIIDKKSTAYRKPIILGDNIQIQMNTEIGPNVILGNNVIIDHSTNISDSIVYDSAYIGSELEIKNKIIFKKRLIDPQNEEIMKIVDSFLVSDIQNNLIESSFMKFINGIIAFVLILFTTLPYVFMVSLASIFGLRINKCKYYLNQDSDTGTYSTYDLPGFNIFKRFFYRFSLELYPLYFKVMMGKISLVGNQRLCPKDGGVKILMQLPAYKPGVYDYASSMLHNQIHENYLNDELEYIHTRSFIFDLKLILHFWISRLFSAWCEISKYLGEDFECNKRSQ